MKKILFTAHIDQHIKHFHIPYLKLCKQNGFETSVASNGNENIDFVDKKYNINFTRNPLSINNLKAYFQLKKILERENFDLIHCNTPVGGLITRLAALKTRKRGTKVIYTAHGFHFYKGAPIKNWIIYYFTEKIMACFTDNLIVINEEDYKIALKGKFKAKKIQKIDGVGIDLSKFNPVDKNEKKYLRNQYKFSEKDFILIYVAELSKRKNQIVLINALNKVSIPNIKLLLVGEGDKKIELEDTIIKHGLDKKVHVLGYRKDVKNLMALSDVSLSSSLQEGLPVNVLEAMAVGLPLIVSGCRGNSDLVVENKNGYIVHDNSGDGFAEYINKMYKNFGEIDYKKENLEKIKKYSLEKIVEEFRRIYGIQ